MCRLSTFDQIIVTAIIGAALFLCLCLTSCTGEQLAPGAKARLQLDGKGGMMLETTRDTMIQSATVTVPGSGVVLTLNGYNGNGSTLGAIQGTSSVEMERMYAQNFDTLMREVIGPILRQYVSSGGISIPSTGGGTTTPLADLAALKATLTARIDACPVLAQNPTLRDSLKAQLARVTTAEGASVLQGIVDALYKTSVTP